MNQLTNLYYILSLCSIGAVIVQCSQTGKEHAVKVKDLSREDAEPLTPEALTKGASLMLSFKGKPYPVKFQKFKGKQVGCVIVKQSAVIDQQLKQSVRV